LHKAFLRHHDPDNWPLLREALKRMGRADLIGNGKRHLIPPWQPAGTGAMGGEGARTGRKHGVQTFLTQHTGLPPRADGSKPLVPAARNRENRENRPKPPTPDRRPTRAFTQGSPGGGGRRPRRP
jgi:hypothetical protein